MNKVAIITDSNSGITQAEGTKLGINVLPMPFTIDGQTFYEDINLSQDEFYKKLMTDAEVFTSQPVVGDVSKLWDEVLKEYDEIVHIPMSSGLSGSCQTALMLAGEYDGRVQVVDSQRVSVTQKWDVLDALELSKAGKSAKEIKEHESKNRKHKGETIVWHFPCCNFVIGSLYPGRGYEQISPRKYPYQLFRKRSGNEIC